MINVLTLLVIFILTFSSNAYTPAFALELAHMSSIAYSSQSAIDNWSCSECKKFSILNQKSFFNTVANIQGFAGYLPSQKCILLAFRGSADFKNWLANLNTASVTYPGCSGCHVHQGFYTAYKGVGPTVRK